MAFRMSFVLCICLMGVALTSAEYTGRGRTRSDLLKSLGEQKRGRTRADLLKSLENRGKGSEKSGKSGKSSPGSETEIANIFGELLDNVWNEFKSTHAKEYEEVEEAFRRGNWEKLIADVLIHNLEADLGVHSFTMGINALSDLTLEEVIEKFTGAKEPADHRRRALINTDNFRDIRQIPASVNLVEEGAVTSVKNQGQCGCCYAFSAAAAMEGMHYYATGDLRNISVQNVLDCGSSFACNGGWMSTVWDWVKTTGGIDGWSCYGRDYQTKPASDCLYKSSGDCWVTTVTKSNYVPKADEEAMAKAIYSVGPLSVAIAVVNSFQSYKSGVYDSNDCDKPIDHAVTVVGYGTEDGKDYWLVKNSWGAWWGEKGYIKMARGKNMCRIADYAMYPTVDSSGGDTNGNSGSTYNSGGSNYNSASSGRRR